MIAEGFRRHDLVWLDSDIDAASYAVNAEDQEFVCNWVSRNWPLVVARQSDAAAMQAGQMMLGITLPSAPARKRIALRVPQAAIISYSRPLKLQDAIAYAPQQWRDHLLLVSEICASNAVLSSVYGSLSAQAFTGQIYLDAASDVDVLFECGKDTQLQKLFEEIEALSTHPLRIDGEILTANGWAVAWRELATALRSATPDKVLAKSYSETRLLTLAQLFDKQQSHAA
jgi:phosphoribosyl-dephospho-CoA transferase